MDYNSNDPDTVDDDPFPDTMSPMHAGLSSQNSSSGQPFTIVSPLKPDHLVVDERATLLCKAYLESRPPLGLSHPDHSHSFPEPGC